MTEPQEEARSISLADGRAVPRDELLALVYDDLRRIAEGYMRREHSGQTLQPTALVHEAYLRLADQRVDEWRNRAQFIGVAAQSMRRVVVDAARSRGRAKRGSGQRAVTLIDSPNDDQQAPLDPLVLEEALEKLGEINPRYVRIVELRFYGGLKSREIAEVVGVSTTIVERNWAEARGWLSLFLGERDDAEESDDAAESDDA